MAKRGKGWVYIDRPKGGYGYRSLVICLGRRRRLRLTIHCQLAQLLSGRWNWTTWTLVQAELERAYYYYYGPGHWEVRLGLLGFVLIATLWWERQRARTRPKVKGRR